MYLTCPPPLLPPPRLCPRSCFEDLQMNNVQVWLVLDYICDGVYILDIAVRLHTGNEN